MNKDPESFLALPAQDRQDVFEAAASRLDTLNCKCYPWMRYLTGDVSTRRALSVGDRIRNKHRSTFDCHFEIANFRG